jgi:hypothetical protein
VEDARQANIIIDKRPNLTSPTSERVLAFGVNTLGFNLEELRLRYRITPDMMLQVEAGSESLSPRETIAKQYGKLLFAYRF